MDLYVWTLILPEGRRSFGEKYYDPEDHFMKNIRTSDVGKLTI